jgi:hypothetical protein
MRSKRKHFLECAEFVNNEVYVIKLNYYHTWSIGGRGGGGGGLEGRGFVCLFVRLFLFVVEYLASSHCTSHIFALHHRFDW